MICIVGDAQGQGSGAEPSAALRVFQFESFFCLDVKSVSAMRRFSESDIVIDPRRMGVASGS